jgi:hypothetical protein
LGQDLDWSQSWPGIWGREKCQLLIGIASTFLGCLSLDRGLMLNKLSRHISFPALLFPRFFSRSLSIVCIIEVRGAALDLEAPFHNARVGGRDVIEHLKRDLYH